MITKFDLLYYLVALCLIICTNVFFTNVSTTTENLEEPNELEVHDDSATQNALAILKIKFEDMKRAINLAIALLFVLAHLLWHCITRSEFDGSDHQGYQTPPGHSPRRRTMGRESIERIWGRNSHPGADPLMGAAMNGYESVPDPRRIQPTLLDRIFSRQTIADNRDPTATNPTAVSPTLPNGAPTQPPNRTVRFADGSTTVPNRLVPPSPLSPARVPTDDNEENNATEDDRATFRKTMSSQQVMTERQALLNLHGHNLLTRAHISFDLLDNATTFEMAQGMGAIPTIMETVNGFGCDLGLDPAAVRDVRSKFTDEVDDRLRPTTDDQHKPAIYYLAVYEAITDKCRHCRFGVTPQKQDGQPRVIGAKWNSIHNALYDIVQTHGDDLGPFRELATDLHLHIRVKRNAHFARNYGKRQRTG